MHGGGGGRSEKETAMVTAANRRAHCSGRGGIGPREREEERVEWRGEWDGEMREGRREERKGRRRSTPEVALGGGAEGRRWLGVRGRCSFVGRVRDLVMRKMRIGYIYVGGKLMLGYSFICFTWADLSKSPIF